MSKIKDIDIFEIGEIGGNSGSPWSSLLLILRLTTDDGYTGYGEAPTELMAMPVYEELKEISKIFQGKEVTEIQRNLSEAYKHEYWLPISMEATAALSAFEMASWDITGKIYGIPLYNVFGGVYNKEVRAYANGWYPDSIEPGDFVKNAEKTIKMGFSALKFDPFGDAFDYLGSEHVRHAVDIVSAIKKNFSNIDIMIECHGRFNANSAIRAGKAMEAFNPLFIEEPVHPDQMEGLYRFKNEVKIPVALGERVLNRNIFLEYMKNHLVDVIQPDIANFTGLMEAKSAAQMAQSFGMEVAFHNAYGPIQNAATLNIDFTLTNFLIQESFERFWPDWKLNLIKKSNFRLENGYFKIVDKIPGLGIVINEKILEEYTIKTMSPFNSDEPGWVIKGTFKFKR